uniref:TolC family protein n=1 Tax=uncultured Dysgonomonas sp. TaxID=206096 RepID=UPI002609A2A4|nr:TolC family protein [uncultured Dysgonomonas sp.]
MTKIIKRTITLSLISLVTFFSFETSAQYKLSLEELFQKGIEHSIIVQSTYLKTEIANEKNSLAKNKRLPDVAIVGQFGYVGTSTILDKDLSFVKHPSAPDWRQNYQLSAVQPLYEGGRINNGIKKSELEQEIARLSLNQDKANLKLWLVSKYLDLYNLYKQRDIYAISIDEARRRLQDIRKMREEGMITSNDVLRSEIELTNFDLFYQETTNNIALVCQQLSIALGMDEGIVYEPDSAFLSSQMNIDKSIEDYIQTAYLEYPQMRIAKTNIALAKNNLEITKADYLPSLSLQIGNTFQRPLPNTSPVQDLFIDSWGITLNLSYKISSLFDRKHSLSMAKTQINLQELAEEQQRQNIRGIVKSAYLKHQEALMRVKLLETSVEQANENYRIVDTKYFNQLAILTDLLDANTIQLEVELKLTAARTNAVYTYYQLLNVCGKL